MTKVDAGSFNAFTSPNLAPLATAEVDIASKLAGTMDQPHARTKCCLSIFICPVVLSRSKLGHGVESEHHSKVPSLH